MAAVVLFSCSGQTGDGPDGGTGNHTLLLSSDKNLIQAGEDVAVLTLTLDGAPVTEGVVFFDGNNNVLDIADFKFSTETPGEYTLWAAYGTTNSNKISITVVATIICASPLANSCIAASLSAGFILPCTITRRYSGKASANC